MKYLHTCEICRGSLHPVAYISGRFYCPTCKKYFERMENSTGWKEVHA